MHPAIATSIAAELDYYAETVKREWAWPSPAAGFATWLFARRNLPALVDPPRIPATAELDERRLAEAPVLAAYGYLLATTQDPDEDLVDRWTAAATRLSGRDPLPGDRASFFFRPIELLGLALAAVAIADRDPGPRQWLRHVLREGASRLGSDPRSVALAVHVGTVLGAPVGNLRVAPLADHTAASLAILWMIAHEAPHAAASIGLEHGTDEVESQLLHKIMQSRERGVDVAEAAVLYAALISTVRTGLARSDYGRPAALATVVGVLRRFPVIVRELGNRHGNRVSLVDIRDEYDVQDLLRGVLSGLFDDIRDEETGPSHAGLRSRIDLLLKREKIFIETKMTRASLDQRKVTEELAIDKELYRSHPDCKTLVCFVYDPGHRLANPTALEDDLTDHDGPLPTVVIVAPHA